MENGGTKDRDAYELQVRRTEDVHHEYSLCFTMIVD